MSIHSMNLEEKVGQLFIGSITGSTISGDIIHLLKNFHIGGIFYKKENVMHPKQVCRLSDRLQAYTLNKYPLFLAVKQEGNTNNAITKGITSGLNQQELGKINNRLYTKQMARMVGKELHAMGINMNLSPNLHLSIENERAFSDQIDHVAKHGRAMIDGYTQANVISTVGPFPEAILHETTELPLYKTALQPFVYAIQHGAQSILTAEMSTDNIFLRNELAFNGLIIQDVSKKQDMKLATINGINNEADMILVNASYQQQIQLIEATIEAVKVGAISEDNINTALHRTYQIKSGLTKTINYDREAFQRSRNKKFIDKLNRKLEAAT